MKRRYRRGIGKSTGKGPKRPAVAEVAEGGAQQIEDRRSDMINDKECNHAEAIAKDFYGVVSEDNGGGWKSWEDLTDSQRLCDWRSKPCPLLAGMRWGMSVTISVLRLPASLAGGKRPCMPPEQLLPGLSLAAW